MNVFYVLFAVLDGDLTYLHRMLTVFQKSQIRFVIDL